jgi:hypothetical protein
MPVKKAAPKKKTGRPLIAINWKQVDQMCAIHCTGEEQAAILEISYDTLEAACKREKKLSFPDYFKQKSASGKMSLRRRQYSEAMEGNTTMLVWLGKNWLDQTDKQEVKQEHTITGFEVVDDAGPSESD